MSYDRDAVIRVMSKYSKDMRVNEDGTSFYVVFPTLSEAKQVTEKVHAEMFDAFELEAYALCSSVANTMRLRNV